MYFFILFVTLSLISTSCSEEEAHSGLDPLDTSEVKEVYITDRTGVDWNITHAVRTYRWNPDNFRFGLGMNRIKAINNPQFFHPGESGYPDSQATFMVLGVEIDGDARAYAVNILKSHEIVNDQFGENYVAVTY